MRSIFAFDSETYDFMKCIVIKRDLKGQQKIIEYLRQSTPGEAEFAQK